MVFLTSLDIRATLRLALPVAAVQLGIMAMGVVDTIMVGRVSPVALAAAALGNLYFFIGGIFGQGTLMMLDPVIAQDRIRIFKHNLERFTADHDSLVEELRITLLHEIGHHLGWDEDDLAARGLA